MRFGVALAVAALAFGAAFAIARSGGDSEPRTVRGVQPAGAAEAPPPIRMPAAAGALPPLPKKPRKPKPSEGPVSSPPAATETTPSAPTITPPSNDGGGGGGGTVTPRPNPRTPTPPTPDPPPPPDSDG